MLRIVQTENGRIQGLPAADPRITSFKGIPFAAPPLGKNRWKAPQPAKNWEGIYKAFEFGPISMQPPVGVNKEELYSREWHVDPEIPMNEDCLYLNVWTPAESTEEKLPVLVWFFGGMLQVGYTSEMEFDGERIARRGVIVVTVNYRLNAFGFFSHPEITNESPEAPANFGHLDQRAGTQWVKRNIAAFGGDPDNITIGGQSAGGGSVLSQLTSPQNEGLFQKAIIESGLITDLYPKMGVPIFIKDLKEAEEDGKAFFDFLCVETLEEARAIDATVLNQKICEYGHIWGTVIDQQYCVGDPFRRMVQNQWWQVPLLMGFTADEFMSSPQVSSVDELTTVSSEMFGKDSEEFLSIIQAGRGSIEEIKERATVRWIEYAVRVVAEANINHGCPVPMYMYQFNAEIPGWDHPGAFHSVDLWFFFETLAKCWRPFVGKHYDLARQMCDYWAHFIRSGNPNGLDSIGCMLPQWESYSLETPYGMMFSEGSRFVEEESSPLMEFLVKEYFKRRRNC